MRSNLVRFVPVVVALAGAALFHRYTLLTGLDRVQADTGDSRFVAFLLEHWLHVVQGQADWRSLPIFWPVRGTLAYSEMLLGMGLPHAVLRAALPLFAAMNAQLILLSIATFGAGFLLLTRGFRLSVWGATAGAYFIAFCWPRFAQLLHVQLQFTPLLPLLLLLALEIGRDGLVLRRRAVAWRAGALSAGLALLLATTLYFAVFVALSLCIATGLCLLSRPARTQLGAVCRRHAMPLAGAALLFAALTAPIVAFYLPLVRESRGRTWADVVPALPTLSNLAWMGPENLVWGPLFARWPTATIMLRRAELRIGVGAIASTAWVVAILLTLRRPRGAGLVGLAVLTGWLLQLLMLQVGDGLSLWWLVWSGFPGAAGIRAVARMQLLIVIAMAVGFGWLIDRTLARWPRRWLAVAALVVLAALEQVGATQTYSGRLAADLSRRVADAIPVGCAAAFVLAPDDVRFDPAVLDEAGFNAAAYLLANPDVASTWKGTAWEHYDRFGRAEHRTLDLDAAVIRNATVFFAYNYTIPLAAQMRHVPVVNGISGWQPPGWNLFDVLSPAAPARLDEWLRLKHVSPGTVCTVPIRITLPEIIDPPARLMP